MHNNYKINKSFYHESRCRNLRTMHGLSNKSLWIRRQRYTCRGVDPFFRMGGGASRKEKFEFENCVSLVSIFYVKSNGFVVRPDSAFKTYSCIAYEFFKLLKLCGGGGQNDMFATLIFTWGRILPATQDRRLCTLGQSLFPLFQVPRRGLKSVSHLWTGGSVTSGVMSETSWGQSRRCDPPPLKMGVKQRNNIHLHKIIPLCSMTKAPFCRQAKKCTKRPNNKP